MNHESFTIAIDKRLITDMPIVTFDGGITVIESAEDAIDALAFLRTQSLVGFDTETKPNFRKGVTNRVSLIQVSTDNHSFLFRINKCGFTPELREFMECDDVVKVGLSLKDDFHMLHRIGEFEPCNFIDLQDIVKNFHITDLSLQKIYAILFQERISKGQRLTNWEAPRLSGAQMVYASIDAWACRRIYIYLKSGAFIPEDSPYIVTPEPTDKDETTQPE